MNCKKCNAELQEGALFCPECMDRFAVNEQKAKVEEASKASKNTTLTLLHSPLFLIAAICFTVTFVSSVISIFTGGIGGIFSNLLPLIFSLIAVIGLWGGVTAKEGKDLNKVLRNASIYDAYQSVMYTISVVIISIIGAIVVVMSFVGGGLVGGIFGDSDSDAASAGIIAGIVALVCLTVVIVIISIIRNFFRNRRLYFKALGESCVTGNYNIAKAPVVGSFIVGIFNILGAVPALLFTVLKEAFIEPMLENFGEFGEFINGLLSGMAASMIVSALGSIILAGYYICTALWMSSVHKAQLKNGAALVAAQAELDKVIADTEDAIRTLELQNKKKHENERAEADLAAKQQQMMMQQMMMQMMMQQQGNMAAAAPAAPAAPAEPVAEAPAETPSAE